MHVHVLENVVEVVCCAVGALLHVALLLGFNAVCAVTVVDGTELFVAENAVGFVDELEQVLGLRVLVGMVLDGKLAEGLLDVGRAGIAWDTQRLVVIGTSRLAAGSLAGSRLAGEGGLGGVVLGNVDGLLAGSVFEVLVGLEGNERPHGISAAADCRQVERRVLFLVQTVEIGTLLGEQLDNVDKAALGSVMQGGLLHRAALLRVCALVQQELDHRVQVGEDGKVDAAFAVRCLVGHARAIVEQASEHGRLARLGGNVHRQLAAVVALGGRGEHFRVGHRALERALPKSRLGFQHLLDFNHVAGANSSKQLLHLLVAHGDKGERSNGSVFSEFCFRRWSTLKRVVFVSSKV
ncbi:hypothetical protein CAOG_009719 [Capsaspora owczarzaki ATCC 30864]|uniref:Uncharacterized protein n=1 Tax=Capsaspora owczarzaki (strain ATCC 30864) TaxID=595528 RepID=A0A0D2X2R4_CAPO3|nr:hypothetical protein CAOG_009719 [Capsaspora owczarzaki ATCC 30864]